VTIVLKSGSPTSWNSQGLSRPAMGLLALSLTYVHIFSHCVSRHMLENIFLPFTMRYHVLGYLTTLNEPKLLGSIEWYRKMIMNGKEMRI